MLAKKSRRQADQVVLSVSECTKTSLLSSKLETNSGEGAHPSPDTSPGGEGTPPPYVPPLVAFGALSLMIMMMVVVDVPLLNSVILCVVSFLF